MKILCRFWNLENGIKRCHRTDLGKDFGLKINYRFEPIVYEKRNMKICC
jgi:hypothetical protein